MLHDIIAQMHDITNAWHHKCMTSQMYDIIAQMMCTCCVLAFPLLSIVMVIWFSESKHVFFFFFGVSVLSLFHLQRKQRHAVMEVDVTLLKLNRLRWAGLKE